MNIRDFSKQQWVLVFGDIVAILVTVAIGFQSHETQSIFLQRFAFTFFPWSFAWLLLAPHFGLFEESETEFGRLVFKVLLVMLLASPLASILRAAWLGGTALPLFALIMGASSAAGILIWRVIYYRWINNRIS